MTMKIRAFTATPAAPGAKTEISTRRALRRLAPPRTVQPLDIEIVLAEAKRHEFLASAYTDDKMRADHIRVAGALRAVACAIIGGKRKRELEEV
jgi:hypothetical protein